MKVLYTDEALRNIDDILTYLHSTFPTAAAGFEQKLRG